MLRAGPALRKLTEFMIRFQWPGRELRFGSEISLKDASWCSQVFAGCVAVIAPFLDAGYAWTASSNPDEVHHFVSIGGDVLRGLTATSGMSIWDTLGALLPCSLDWISQWTAPAVSASAAAVALQNLVQRTGSPYFASCTSRIIPLALRALDASGGTARRAGLSVIQRMCMEAPAVTLRWYDCFP